MRYKKPQLHIKSCIICDEEFAPNAPRQHYCENCRPVVKRLKCFSGTPGRAKENYIQKRLPMAKLSDMVNHFKEHGWCCSICGDEMQRKDVSIDHIIPISQGGDDSLSNIQFAHRSCNGFKGRMNPEQLLVWCKKVIQYHDNLS